MSSSKKDLTPLPPLTEDELTDSFGREQVWIPVAESARRNNVSVDTILKNIKTGVMISRTYQGQPYVRAWDRPSKELV